MKNFYEEYLEALRNMVRYHVRPAQREQCLLRLLSMTNELAGSTVWRAVEQVMEDYGFNVPKLLK